MAKLSNDDVLKLARLSKLELTEEQLNRFKTELEKIVDYVEQLQDVDVTGLEPTYQLTGLTNVMRPDEIREYSPREELLKNVPEQEAGSIKVKRVLD